MPTPFSDWNPPRRHLRRLAWLIALGIAALAWFWPDPLEGLGLRLAAALVFATGTVWPGLFRWPYRALTIVSTPLRRALSGVLPALFALGLVAWHSAAL